MLPEDEFSLLNFEQSTYMNEQGEKMSEETGEMIETAVRRLDFVSGMLLAWDVDRIEVDEEVIDGWWYMIECIKKDLEAIKRRRDDE